MPCPEESSVSQKALQAVFRVITFLRETRPFPTSSGISPSSTVTEIPVTPALEIWHKVER